MNLRKCFAMSFIALFGFFSLSILMAQTEIETPKESEVINNLSQRCVVFLCFHKDTEPNIFAIKSSINSVANSFKGAVAVVYVSSDEKAEKKLREKFEVSSDTTAVFIVVPPGRAVAKLEGTDITKTNLMRALYASCGSGCSPSGCK